MSPQHYSSDDICQSLAIRLVSRSAEVDSASFAVCSGSHGLTSIKRSSWYWWALEFSEFEKLISWDPEKILGLESGFSWDSLTSLDSHKSSLPQSTNVIQLWLQSISLQLPLSYVYILTSVAYNLWTRLIELRYYHGRSYIRGNWGGRLGCFIFTTVASVKTITSTSWILHLTATVPLLYCRKP